MGEWVRESGELVYWDNKEGKRPLKSHSLAHTRTQTSVAEGESHAHHGGDNRRWVRGVGGKCDSYS